MYRSAPLRVQCISCAAELPTMRCELTAGGYVCLVCRYGTHREPPLTSCAACRVNVKSGDTTYSARGPLCARCAVEADLARTLARSDEERRLARRRALGATAGVAVGVLYAIAWLLGN